MIGERIRQARVMAGMSQDELVRALHERQVQLTKAALSKYECGKSSPKASLLMHLGHVLDVPPSYFLEEPAVMVKWLAYRRHSRLGLREREHIHELARAQVEAYVRLRTMLVCDAPRSFPERMDVSTPEEAERVAAEVRRMWGLVDCSIESMTELIEDHDGIVVALQAENEQFHGLSGVANSAHAVIIVDAGAPDDRKRFTIAHELGHLIMNTEAVGDERKEEQLAQRFAAAFLLPAPLVQRELGARRAHVSLEELALLKQKHGVSMQGWVLRARDLGIIDEGHFATLIRRVRGRNEQVEFHGHEVPMRMRQMALRAMAEGLISRAQAAAWCPDIAAADARESALQAPQAITPAHALLRYAAEERDKVLTHAAESCAPYYKSMTDAGSVDAGTEDWEDIYSGRKDT